MHTVPGIRAIEDRQRRELSPFRVGDTLKVHYRIHEGDKERIQIFQGTVIRKSRGGIGATFCVRKVALGVGVERIFPLHSPRIEKVEVVSSGRVRRSRLYYLRALRGKAARLREISRGNAPSKGRTRGRKKAAKAS
ncbi:MAG: 50S ribosomal protein L19 [Proteobacteria bacterium]|nr:50S ribosomal protein L19 [Pseudomonadota bacterium]